MRIGFGYDNHRLIEGRPLMIGGINIPSQFGEDAHSDGDVLIHAIIDALLGATAKGDIGMHFPPSDERYRNVDSKELLKETLKITNANIVNIDTTVVLEKVKLKPYIEEIRKTLALILNTHIDMISVKAKTHEGMDSTGKGEAIEAYAVVLTNN